MGKSKEKKKMRRTAEEAEEEEVVNFRIKVIPDNPDKTSPVIGYFPSGYDPHKYANDTDLKPSVKIYKSVNSRNPKNPRMQVVVSPQGSLVNFVGTNYSGEATTPQLCNYALGVVDKKAGVIKMVPIAANRIFRLEPRIAGMEETENEPVDEEKKEMTNVERADKIKDLTSMYSTKKNMRRDEKRDTLRQTEDPGTQDNKDYTLTKIEINSDALGAVISANNARDIPPYDEEATSPELAYPLDKIILKGEWAYLQDVFDLVETGAELDPNKYPTFVCNRVHKCENIMDKSERMRMAGVLSFITHLIKYKDRHSMDGVSSVKHHWMPSILSQKFSSMFPTAQKERLSEEKQKLLVHYVLVLSLIFDDFRSDLTDIAKDLRMNTVSLRSFYEYLGCKFVKEKKVLLATLPVPLQFQTEKRKKRSR